MQGEVIALLCQLLSIIQLAKNELKGGELIVQQGQSLSSGIHCFVQPHFLQPMSLLMICSATIPQTGSVFELVLSAQWEVYTCWGDYMQGHVEVPHEISFDICALACTKRASALDQSSSLMALSRIL